MYQSLFIVLIIILSSCSAPESDKFDSKEMLMVEKINKQFNKFEKLNYKSSKNKDLIFPFTLNEYGNIEYVEKDNWTSGFYPGMLWLIYDITEEKFWEEKAIYYTENLKQEQFNSKSEDLGLKMMCSFGNGYRINKNKEYLEILLNSARTVVSNFDEKQGYIKNTSSLVNTRNIDEMMNLEILFFAYNQTGDPVFYNIAVKHAETTMNRNKLQNFNIKSEESINKQVRNLYGFVQVFQETQNPVFLKYSERLAGIILNSNLLQKSDVLSNNDTLESTILASALYQLSNDVENDKERYKTEADKIMNRIFLKDCFLKPVSKKSNIELTEESNYSPLIYTNYYFLEGLKQMIKSNKY